MKLSKLVPLLLITAALMLLVGCSGDVAPPAQTAPSTPAQVPPTPTATLALTYTPTASTSTASTPTAPTSTAPTSTAPTPTAPTPTASRTQSTGVSKSEILHEFNGSGTGKTDTFEAGRGAEILISYTGGPIVIYWIERDDPPRQIYNGPSSSNGNYDFNIAESGRYSISIKCDADCQWTIRIQSIGGIAVSAPAQKPGQSNRTTNADVSTILASTIRKEEWDVLSNAEASVILSAPNTRAITLGYDPGTRMASITGAKTSVPPKAHVMVANLELGNFVLVKADQDGKFEAEIDGHPGTHILIKQDTTGQIFNVEDPQATHGPNTLRTIFPPGVLLRIPVKDSDTGVSFSSAGRLPSDEDAPWTIEGNLAEVELSPGQEVAISGRVAIRTGESNRPPNGQLRFGATLLVNSDGRQVGGGQEFHDITFYRNRLTHRTHGPVKGILLCWHSPTQLAFRGRTLG